MGAVPGGIAAACGVQPAIGKADLLVEVSPG